MATQLTSSSSSGFNRGHSIPTTLAEINVTPLVDVMLVLLIVFMISAPLMQQGIQINLPHANTGSMDETPEQLILKIDKNRRISLAENFVENATLFKKLGAIVGAKPQVEIVIQADQGLNYGFVAQVMAEVKRAGIQRVGLATEPGDHQLK